MEFGPETLAMVRLPKIFPKLTFTQDTEFFLTHSQVDYPNGARTQKEQTLTFKSTQGVNLHQCSQHLCASVRY